MNPMPFLQPQELANLLPQEAVCSASRLGLALRPDLGLEAWSRLIAQVARATSQFSGSRVTLTAWLGDLLAYGEGKYRGQIKEYARAAGLEPGTLRTAKLVCLRIPLFSRLDTLSWAHHWEVGVAIKDSTEIRRWLETAAQESWSKAELRKRIRSHLAASNQAPTAQDQATPSFALLRELRAVDRYLLGHPKIWAAWSPAACRQALAQIASVAEFVETLKHRAAGCG